MRLLTRLKVTQAGMKEKHPDHTDFPGFADTYDHNPGSGAFLRYPLIMEEYWHLLTGAEQKCLDFVIRQTIGWSKERDAISWSQFANGVGGKSKGKGTGLAISTIRTAVDGLEKKGFFTITRRKNRPCIFVLVMEKGPERTRLDAEEEHLHKAFGPGKEDEEDDDEDMF